MKKISILLILLLSIASCKSKKTTYKNGNFPTDWVGNYHGDLIIYGVDSINMKLPMDLNIKQKNDSLYAWEIIYNFKGKKDIRKYELLVKDEKRGHYIIDEKNSIKINAFYRKNIFTSFFKVMNSYIVATYTKENNSIIFEIISATDSEKTITGNTIQGLDTIPKVTTFFVNGRQKAILSKLTK